MFLDYLVKAVVVLTFFGGRLFGWPRYVVFESATAQYSLKPALCLGFF
jgi:hypothetical protein